MKQVYFYNKTDVPIMIDYWIDETWVENICCVNTIKLEPGQKRYLHSSTGEWIVHSDFTNSHDLKRWKDKGYTIAYYIGKCNIEKDIYHLADELFRFHYLETLDEENNNCGNILFCYKKIKID